MNWKILALLNILATGAAGAADHAFFALDTGTKDAQHQTAEAQVAMIEAIGFAGIGPIYTTPQALREMLAALDRHQLKMFAVYVRLDLDAANPVTAALRNRR